MSQKTEISEDELTIPEEGGETINIGRYIGGRNSAKERDGKGWAILPNGDQYDGQYRQGKRHGIGLYVFVGGARYYGQYRCGYRSGRGIFIYPDGSYYDGLWRKNLKHGQGRYYYANGDSYSGSWYRGLRHGVGIYTINNAEVTSGCNALVFKGTWNKGIRVGPFQLTYGNDEKCITLHGTWDNKYPQGPAIFSFDKNYLLMGYFWSKSRQNHMPSAQEKRKSFNESTDALDEATAEEHDKESNAWNANEPSSWYAQEICRYDYSLLPQEPVPLPLSDSEISVCSLKPKPIEIAVQKQALQTGEEGEEEDGPAVECIPCECECSSSEVETSSQNLSRRGDPCAIEIMDQKDC